MPFNCSWANDSQSTFVTAWHQIGQ